jgi:membrane-associated protease RseP (regulator of RpoE activity)
MKIKMIQLLRSAANLGLIPTLCLAAGCGTPKEKPLLSRGWVGGQVALVRDYPKSMIPRPKAAILLTALATNTPAAVAGLHEGDLVLALDHQPVEKLRDFRRKIDSLVPGNSLPVTAWRDGKIKNYTVVVGRETYRKGGNFTIFFPGIVGQWNLWPHGDYPGLSLVALGYQMNDAHRLELGSVERQYDLKCNPRDTPYTEDYKIWIAFMEFSKGKRIAGQQLADAVK